ncbi:major facilitator superfamily domain-containing protein, partial [Dimargaris cristalligena]
LPRRQITVLLLFRISEPISFTVLFPFVYFMVRDFHITDDPKEIGFYVGLVASAFSIAQLTTGMLWGFLSDRIGRRPITLLGVMGTIVCSVLFGMSQSLAWAVTVRALWGALNGNTSTAKTIMAEITDETNQARGFSLLPLCRNLGSIVGPMIGGLLSNPVDNYPSIFGDSVLFAKYPYLLPCLFCAALSTCSWVLGYFYLEETLNREMPKVRNLASASGTTLVDECDSNTRADTAKPTTGNSKAVISAEIDDVDFSGRPLLAASQSASLEGLPEPHTKPQPSAWASVTAAFNRDSLKCITGYFGLALLGIMFDELYPVWSATDPDLGGIGLTTKTIGLTLSIAGVSVLYVQIVMYPKVQRYLGSLLCFRYGALLFSILLFAFPFISLLEADRRTGHSADFHNSTEAEPQPIRTVTWIALIAALFAKVCGGTLCFTSANILINNSVPNRAALGTVNGFTQSVGSLARAIGPMLAGILWSWSLTNGY